MKTFFSVCRRWVSGWWQGWQNKRTGFSAAGPGVAGQTVTALAPQGFVCLAGELWAARSPFPVARGETVKVVGSEGVWLVVRPLTIKDGSPAGRQEGIANAALAEQRHFPGDAPAPV
ncbi:NfeD family protein [Chloracidobacterium thermophilum]|uniref:NfeD family protein n=1 Tax=Chloracidobacterium thermophilum TaxID=458033 RepID=UPI0007389B91|nr:NfeD family protein [Chloracidobacterium thermophilum]